MPLANGLDLEHLLLLLELQGHVGSNGIGQTPRLIDARQRGQDLRRNLAVQLDVVLELGNQRALEHVRFAGRDIQLVLDEGDVGGKELGCPGLGQIGPRAALDEHLHRAIRQLQQLQNRGQRTDPVDVLEGRLVHIGLLLGDEQNLLAGLHRLVQRLNRTRAPHKQRNDHVRVNDHIPQRQDRYVQAVLRIGVRHPSLLGSESRRVLQGRPGGAADSRRTRAALVNQ